VTKPCSIGKTRMGRSFSLGMFRCFIAPLCLWVGAYPASRAFVSDRPAVAQMFFWDGTEAALHDAPEPRIPVTERGLPLTILKDQIPTWVSPHVSRCMT
jgi:hypothetical protein